MISDKSAVNIPISVTFLQEHDVEYSDHFISTNSKNLS